jgi:hypothetical protein
MRYSDVEHAARQQNWRVERTKRGHRRLVPPDPDKPIVIGAGSGGDRFAVNLFLIAARRSGLVWPWPPPRKHHSRPDSAREPGD